ncbi:hypothetical protein LPJ61_004505, partial [Coemansia biformis]
AERYRRMLVERRRADAQRLAQLRRDVADDRAAYTYTHGPTAPDAARPSAAARPGRRQPPTAARLLIRASNGDSTTATFEPGAAFGEVRALVESTFDTGGGRAEIVLAASRRLLGAADDGRTVRELGLCPSAALLVRVATPAKARAKPLPPLQGEAGDEEPRPRRRRAAALYLPVYLLLAAAALALLAWHQIDAPAPAAPHARQQHAPRP